MKTIDKLLPALALLLVMCPAGLAQEKTQTFKRHEISVGIGGPSLWPLIDGLGCDDYAPRGILESLYEKKYGDEHYTPSFTVSHNYFSKKWLSFNTRLTYSAAYNYVYTGVDSHVDYLDVSPAVSITEMIQFTYLNREKVRLYSSLGGGVSVYKGGILPSLQFTFFGVSFGKKVFGFVEYGSGTTYLVLNGGIGYRF